MWSRNAPTLHFRFLELSIIVVELPVARHVLYWPGYPNVMSFILMGVKSCVHSRTFFQSSLVNKLRYCWFIDRKTLPSEVLFYTFL